jgi:hypothetical protein
MPKLEQRKQRLSNQLLLGNLVDEQETNKPIRQTVVLIDKDQRPVGKLGTLSPLMNNVQKFGR